MTTTETTAWTPPVVLAVIGMGVVILGSLLPWATLSVGPFSRTVAGTDADGVLTLPIAVVGLLVFVVRRQSGITTLLTGLLTGVPVGGIALYDIINVSNMATDLTTHKVRSLSASVSVGVGLWLCLAGAILTIAASVATPSARKAAE